MKKTVIAILLFNASQFACAKIATLFVDAEEPTSIVLWGLLISQIILIPLFWLIKYYHPKDLVKSVPGSLSLKSIILVITGTLAFNMLTTLSGVENELSDMFNGLASLKGSFFAIAILGPVLEEIVFRRVIVDELWTRWGKPWLAILFSAFLFGLVHFNPAQSMFAFMIGILFGWVYVRTGSMMPGLVAHMINNTLGFMSMRMASMNPEMVEQAAGSNPNVLPAIIILGAIALIMLWRIGPIPSDIRLSRIKPANEPEQNEEV